MACSGESRYNRREYLRELVAHVEVIRKEYSNITFTSNDMYQTHPHDDALVVILKVGNCLIKCILVDNGSSTNVIVFSTMEAMGINPVEIEKTKGHLSRIQ